MSDYLGMVARAHGPSVAIVVANVVECALDGEGSPVQKTQVVWLLREVMGLLDGMGPDQWDALCGEVARKSGLAS